MTTNTVAHREDLFTTYDVVDGYCRDFKGKSADSILKAIEAKLDKSLFRSLEYITANEDVVFDPKCRRVIVYTVRGDSEGYYLHVDMVSQDGKLKNLVLAKTCGTSASIKELEQQIWEIVDRE